ncbi:MFS transporter [Sorangium sp. So ce315]|uniref:MFS transporter n=1 Tax=Sorangium sp. So ce315 TaxID=3133299 RepID=UPI003F5F9138
MSKASRAADVPALSALTHRDFRVFWIGQSISHIGDWMLVVGGGWLTAQVTSSATTMAMVDSVATLPMILLMLSAGVVADRYERRKVMLVAQVLFVALSLLGAALVASQRVTVGLMCVWYLLLGAIMSLNAPARHALLADLVPPEHLASAVSLRGAAYHASQLVGSALAAALLAVAPLYWIFIANALSFLPLIYCLLVIRPRATPVQESARVGVSVADGLRYAWRSREVRTLLGAMGLVSVCVLPFSQVFWPIFVEEALAGSELDLAVLTSGSGLGALLGFLAFSRVRVRGRLGVALGSGALIACALWGLSLTSSRTVAVGFAALMAFGIGLMLGALSTLLQLAASNELRGRVMGLSEIILVGITPLSSVTVGAGIDAFGVRYTMRLAGLCCLLPVTVLLLRMRRAARREGTGAKAPGPVLASLALSGEPREGD